MLWHRSKNWQMKDGEMVLFAQPLLDYSLGAYIEYWLMSKIQLLKVIELRTHFSVALRKQETHKP
jgi:hypothetical protein